jgi:hypothetical protein
MISYAVVALGVGLACLLAGFLWGRSNLKAKVEQAVEEGHSALDAREFAMRQQVDEAIAEIARLRPMAEELGRVQDRLKLEQSKYERMKAEFDATLKGGAAEDSVEQEPPVSTPQLTMTPESADEAIQKLLQSLEALNQPDTEPNHGNGEPAVPAASEHRPAVEPVVVAQARPVTPPPSPQAAVPARPIPPSSPPVQRTETPRTIPGKPVSTQPAKPKPPEVKAPVQKEKEPAGQPVDEWQEFARSLEALTGRKE